MTTFTCACGARLFFESVQCLGCGREVGWCPRCARISAVEPERGDYRCCTAGCGADLVKCHNYAQEAVCNRLLERGDELPSPQLCDCCVHNVMIPDLSVAGHRQRWADLEAAKRRLFYTLDLVGLPHETEGPLPLSFAFMTDAVPEGNVWRVLPGSERIYTGHANGRITIDVKEADDVERERVRVDLNETQRTLIGHFRHELGHYYWDRLVQGAQEESFVDVFGDFRRQDYAAALAQYYDRPCPPDWATAFLSPYATMHPWEDFAETFAFFLTMTSLLDTAAHWGVVPPDAPGRDLPGRLEALSVIGQSANEMNRDMGLKDLLPYVATTAIERKLRYVDELIRHHRESPASPRAS